MQTEGISMLGSGMSRHEEIPKAAFSFKGDKLYMELQSLRVDHGQYSRRRTSI
jgi:hypothetical protein